MTLGEQIAELRKKHGLTQADLGKKLKVSQSMISQYENGTRFPAYSTLLKIVTAIGGEDLLHRFMSSNWRGYHYDYSNFPDEPTEDIAELILDVEKTVIKASEKGFYTFDSISDVQIDKYLSTKISALNRQGKIELIKYLSLLSQIESFFNMPEDKTESVSSGNADPGEETD